MVTTSKNFLISGLVKSLFFGVFVCRFKQTFVFISYLYSAIETDLYNRNFETDDTVVGKYLSYVFNLISLQTGKMQLEKPRNSEEAFSVNILHTGNSTFT